MANFPQHLFRISSACTAQMWAQRCVCYCRINLSLLRYNFILQSSSAGEHSICACYTCVRIRISQSFWDSLVFEWIRGNWTVLGTMSLHNVEKTMFYWQCQSSDVVFSVWYNLTALRRKRLVSLKPNWLCLENISPYKEFESLCTASTSPTFLPFCSDSHSERYIFLCHCIAQYTSWLA